MSAPSSHGRPSGDSDRWTASSNTYIASNAGAYTDNGEGSSSPRRSQDSRPSNGAPHGLGIAMMSSDNDDSAQRKQRPRRSGGFLLDSTFPSGPRQRHGHRDAHGGDDSKGKRNSRHQVTHENKRSSALGASREHHGDNINMDRTRRSVHQMPSASHDRDPSPRTEPARQAIDPTHLVHMALNLSESRRRNISTGQLLASQPRAASGSQREGSFANYAAGGSLRHYLNEQRRVSRNISPMGGRGSPSRHMSTSMQGSGSMAFPGPQSINPSASTLARVNKAKAYIELQMEYLRLLDFLPPLKPDANAPGNFIFTSSSSPGSPQAHLTRTPSHAGRQHDLGRAYNPLQFIRNRRIRARERVVLDHPPEEFENIQQVRDWVDQVEQHAKRVGYRRNDTVHLPKIQDHEVAAPPSKPPRPHKGWFFTPEELLADAHWLEQGDNKTLVENRRGQKLFPPKEAQPRDSFQVRTSKEFGDKRGKSWADALPAIALDHTTGDESDKASERGRKRRLLPGLRTDSPRGGKHSRRGSRLRNHDEPDSSGSESDTKKRKIRVATDPEHNTGPLALLLEQQAKEFQAKSPLVMSPNTPDKWGRNGDVAMDDRPTRDSLDVPRFSNGFSYLKDHGNFKISPTPRKPLNLSSDDAEPRSSHEQQDSTAPNTPLTKRFPYIGSEASPPQSRSNSQTRKPKRHKFNNIFHPHDHSEESQHEGRPGSSGTDRKGKSHQNNGETADDKPIGTAILAAPGAVMNLLGHRKNDSVSSLPSPDKLRRREAQEPQSAVTRFFKGVRHEGTKVGDIIFRRDRADDSDSETMSDNSVEFDDDNGSTRAKQSKRPSIARTNTGGTEGSRISFHKDRSRLDLPSFRPIHVIDNEDSDEEHHISRQNRDLKGSRSPRIDRLLPPRMDLSAISDRSSQGSLTLGPNNSQERLEESLANRSDTGGLPAAGLRNLQDRKASGSRPGMSGRHWSIADGDDQTIDRKTNADIITQADIARVRALFLCSGVKANEIVRRAHATRNPPPEFLVRAAALTNMKLYPVPRTQEHVLAARILVKDLEASTKALQSTLETFRNKAIQQLTRQISTLQSTVDSDLMPRILEGGDKAVRVTSEVSGQGSLQVKQITDEIDRMIRARKRRMRWMRGFGWMLKVFVAQGSSSIHAQSSKGPSSFAALAAAFVPTAVVAILYVVIFIFIRPSFPKIYSPRTYIGTVEEKHRTPCKKSPGYFDWVHTYRTLPDKFVLYHQSLDSYLFLRFLRTLIFICVVGAAITWPILMPANWTGGGRSKELNRLGIGNVKDKNHLYAHAVVAWVFFSLVMFTVARERLWLIGLRQAWNLSKTNAKRLSSRTVLYLSAPTAALDEANMQRFFGEDAVRIWPVTKGDKLVSLVSERDSKVEKLESAELSFVLNINKEVNKSHNGNIKYEQLPKQMTKSLRPTHKSKTPVVGKEVDSISYYRDQIKEKEDEVQKARESNETAGNLGGAAAVFVEFRTQPAAQRAYQQIASADILSLTPRFVGTVPSEIVWSNLVLPPARRISQSGIALSLVIATIVFWSIPVSIVGAISNIQYLAENFKWLAFLNKLPPSLMSLLSGLIPPLLLSALARWVPDIFRYIFTTFGDPTKSVIELKVLKWHYVFQVLQVFLITTLSSGAAAVASQIAQDPSSVPQLLAERLPRASNTYLTYFVVQALTNAPSNVLNYSDVLFYIFYDNFIDKTPRQKYKTHTTLRGMAWGKLFPKYVNFVIIAIAYSCIAPLVLGFAAIGLTIFYWSYRYQLLYTVQPKIDTKGHAYTLSLQHILTGIYIAELCLIGIFSLHNARGPLFMLVLLLIATAIFNYTTNRYFAPLEQYLPADLALESEDDEQSPLLSSAEEGESDALQHAESRVARLSERTRVPSNVISPFARFLQPHVFASHTAMKSWVRDGDFDDEEPEYSDDDVKKAYLHPAYSSKPPVVWLAKDAIGVSKKEISENENVGLKASDEGAWVTGDGKVKWAVDNFEEVPIFKKDIKW
ncbi:hypothetical protein COCSADRAFT_87066 [Bipolaris sorokiniana ND90Pr]|uniref:DUF221-domain-containing protein n=1 Tax=Cochliobolus sativus (strain ND90Pr / ATCC 201652) TaxID=665912 RepID=M2T9T7_COCSN|nr:uncharacterized protein COCSADRAFT_87066 [Bipolaris sorokiniana ND90Pr]EMD65682.1 hypothetical protein COCSADRAFT_87066 [Bipolaris sorokiniana ND90Pr]